MNIIQFTTMIKSKENLYDYLVNKVIKDDKSIEINHQELFEIESQKITITIKVVDLFLLDNIKYVEMIYNKIVIVSFYFNQTDKGFYVDRLVEHQIENMDKYINLSFQRFIENLMNQTDKLKKNLADNIFVMEEFIDLIEI